MLIFIHIKPFNLWSGWVLTTEPGWAVDYPSESPGIILGIYRGPFFFASIEHRVAWNTDFTPCSLRHALCSPPYAPSSPFALTFMRLGI